MLSPARSGAGGSNSVRNHQGPAKIIQEAKLISQLRPTVPEAAIKNYTALELSRFIDKRLTDVNKSSFQYNR